jgi:integrase
MSIKNSRTVCSPMDWEQFLTLVSDLKKAKDYRFLLLVSVGCYCGLRISDILELKWIDIRSKDELEIIETKTGKFRRITFNSVLKDLIEICFDKMSARKNCDTTQYIFANRLGTKLSRQYVNRKLHTIFSLNKIKVLNGSSHTLRKTFGRRVYENNNRNEAALIILSSIFNHQNISVTRRYIGINDEQIKNVYVNL